MLLVDRHAGQERFHDRISFAPPRPAHDRIRKRLSAAPALGTGSRQLGRFKELTILVDEPIEVGKGLVEAGKLRQPQAAEKKKHPGWPSLGDLGVELPPEDVPSIQKRIVRACRESGTPVILHAVTPAAMAGMGFSSVACPRSEEPSARAAPLKAEVRRKSRRENEESKPGDEG